MKLGRPLSALTGPKFANRLYETLWKPFDCPIQVRVELQGNDIENGKLQLGCRAGPVEDVYNLLHEMCHFVEIDDARMLCRNWGLRLPEQYIPGRYGRMAQIPVTIAAIERELRVIAFQWNLTAFLEAPRQTAYTMVAPMKFMPDFVYVPGGYDRLDRKRLRWCKNRMIELSRVNTIDRFMAEWERKNRLLSV